MTPDFMRDFQPALLRYSLVTIPLHVRDCHPLWSDVPEEFRFGIVINSEPITPHLPCGIQFELCRFRSPLLTTSRLISFPPPTKMFQFGGLPIVSNHGISRRIPIRGSPDHRTLASSRSLSQLGTPFIGSQTEPFTDRFNVIQQSFFGFYPLKSI